MNMKHKNYASKFLFSFFLISTLILSTTVQAFASDSVQEQTWTPLNEETATEFLDNLFSSETALQMYVGAAVTIVKDGDVIAQKGYGFADAEEQIPVDPEQTVFRIASVSKTFAAVAIMQLVEQGKIDLHEDIRTYLPEVSFDNPFDTPVTPAHLLTHTSGFEVRDPHQGHMHTDLDFYISMEDYIEQYMPPVVREPGTAYMYDNFAYLLLGKIVQNVSGVPYEEYMEEHIFAPLGMENSGFLLKGHLLEQLVTGYDPAFQPIEPYTFEPTVMPEGGMLATAEDMSKFMLAFLNGGSLDSARVLSEQSVAEMSEYRSSIHPILPNTTYGFEAALQTPLVGSNDAVITKLGDVPGNSSMLLFIPEENVGVFLTYNMQGVLRDLFLPQFMATFFPQYVEPVELEEFQPATAEELAKLAGYYSDLRLAALAMMVEVSGDGKLVINDAYLGPRELTQVDDNLFIDQLTQSFTAFALDENSGRAYMKEPYLNPLGYARQGETAAGYVDVLDDNVYAPYIHALQSLGHFANDGDVAFKPEEAVTRGELVYYLLKISGVKAPEVTEYAFNDIADHPYAASIQFAHTLGMVNGNGNDTFAPDRPATRQEAAVMIWNMYKQMYPASLFEATELIGETDDWAVPAVKMLGTLGLHGPEVFMDENGAVDFLSKQQLTRQEASAVYYQLLFQPVDQIVGMLMQQQAAEQEAPADDVTEEAAEEIADETAQEATEQSIEEATEEVTEELADEATEEMMEEASDEAAKEAVEAQEDAQEHEEGADEAGEVLEQDAA